MSDARRGGWAKVYRRLWDGTMGPDWPTWSVWVLMLAHADADGVVDMTQEALAARGGIPLEAVCAAIARLEAADPRSRSQTEDGRRLVRLDPGRDWGWRVVNYPAYRAATSAERVASFRERELAKRNATVTAPSRDRNATVTPGNQAEAEAEVEEESTPLLTADAASGATTPPATNGKAPDEWLEAFDAHFWPAYPRKVSKPAALRAWRRIKPHDDDRFNTIMDGLDRWVAYWQDKDRDVICHPATWLNGQRWEDQP